jgi:hypothetical protein
MSILMVRRADSTPALIYEELIWPLRSNCADVDTELDFERFGRWLM